MNFQAIIQQITIEVAEKKISVSAMARELGLPQRTLAKILDGDQGIGTRTLARIMDRRPEWWPLLNGSNNRPTGSSEPRKDQVPALQADVPAGVARPGRRV